MPTLAPAAIGAQSAVEGWAFLVTRTRSGAALRSCNHFVSRVVVQTQATEAGVAGRRKRRAIARLFARSPNGVRRQGLQWAFFCRVTWLYESNCLISFPVPTRLGGTRRQKLRSRLCRACMGAVDAILDTRARANAVLRSFSSDWALAGQKCATSTHSI